MKRKIVGPMISLAAAIALAGAPAFAQRAGGRSEPVGLKLDVGAGPAGSVPPRYEYTPGTIVTPTPVPTPAAASAPAAPAAAQSGATTVTAAVEKKPAPFSFSPTLGIAPFGYQKKVPYFSLTPGIAFGGGAKTDNGQIFGYSLGYNFTYLNYLGSNVPYGIPDNNKEFIHSFSFGLTWDFAEKWSTEVAGGVNYKKVSSPEALGDNEIASEFTPSISYKASPDVSLKLAFSMGFWQASDTYMSATDLLYIAEAPAPDETLSGGFIYTPVDVPFIGLPSDPASLYGTNVSPSDMQIQDRNISMNINPNLSWQIVPSTKATFDYWFYSPEAKFNGERNQFGHQGKISLNQKLWAGGGGNLAYTINYNERPFTYVAAAESSLWRMTQSIAVGLSQKLNKYISFSGNYAFRYRASNDTTIEDNYNNNEANQFSIATTFAW
jgi:hypothetical protein